VAVRPLDTAPDIDRRQVEVYRGMTPARRVEIAVAMSEDAFTMAADGIRARHPDYDDAQVRWASFRLRHGDELFRAAWPQAPLLAP
jgi:hypothetical protein